MKIGFVGGGNMARAILGGLIAKGTHAAHVVVVEPDAIARLKLVSEFGVTATETPGAELDEVDAVIFAVKPQQMRVAAERARPHVAKALVVTIAAGIRLTDLSRWLGGATRMVRAMPNTPALVHAGITGLFAASGATASDRATAEQLLAAVGSVLWFEKESDLDAVTAVSGSGPAYVFYMIEALESAAKDLGIGDNAARLLALWTFVGAAKLAIERGEDPATLRAQVTSKGGTTERALEVLEEAQVKRQFIAAVKAAAERSRELGDAFGKS